MKLSEIFDEGDVCFFCCQLEGLSEKDLKAKIAKAGKLCKPFEIVLSEMSVILSGEYASVCPTKSSEAPGVEKKSTKK